MSELDWLRTKATKKAEDVFVITAEQAAEVGDCEPGTYRSELFAFEGNLPFRMMAALRKGPAPLINTGLEHETLKLGNGYRSGYTQCRYYRTVYTKVAA